jgi:hypothetical protein
MAIDHLAEPRIQEHQTADWLHQSRSAAVPSRSCELSGMAAEADGT